MIPGFFVQESIADGISAQLATDDDCFVFLIITPSLMALGVSSVDVNILSEKDIKIIEVMSGCASVFYP